jgi:hypothetical protein
MATHNTITLSKKELDNYGVIISHSIPNTDDDTDRQIKIDKIVENGVQYIHSNLIEPLQATKGFNITQLKSRETSGRTSQRSKPSKYDLYASKMNDFDDLLKKAQSTERTNYINQSLFIELLSNDRKKLEALFYLLKHITNDGLYYYKSQSFNNNGGAKLYINELRKINYEYLTIYQQNGRPDNILLSQLLENFETFKRILTSLDFAIIKYCILSKSFKRLAEFHDSDTFILNFKPITNTDKSFIEELIYRFTGPLFSSKTRRHGIVLNKVIDDLFLTDLLEKAIFSVDKNNIYYIDRDNSEFLKTNNDKILSITYNLTANLYLKEEQIFGH